MLIFFFAITPKYNKYMIDFVYFIYLKLMQAHNEAKKYSTQRERAICMFCQESSIGLKERYH